MLSASSGPYTGCMAAPTGRAGILPWAAAVKVLEQFSRTALLTCSRPSSVAGPMPWSWRTHPMRSVKALRKHCQAAVLCSTCVVSLEGCSPMAIKLSAGAACHHTASTCVQAAFCSAGGPLESSRVLALV